MLYLLHMKYTTTDKETDLLVLRYTRGFSKDEKALFKAELERLVIIAKKELLENLSNYK